MNKDVDKKQKTLGFEKGCKGHEFENCWVRIREKSNWTC